MMRWNLPEEYFKDDVVTELRFAFLPIVVEKKKVWLEQYWVQHKCIPPMNRCIGQRGQKAKPVYRGEDKYWKLIGTYLKENDPRKVKKKKKSSHFLDA